MRHYCTYFDSHYLLRGLTLFRSLQLHEPQFVLWVLCCDDASFEALQTLDLPNLRPIRLSEVEAFEPRLARAKAERNKVEYLWTLTPIWPRFLLKTQPQIAQLTYLDADLFFFAAAGEVFAEIGDASVALFGHRFSPHIRDRTVNGIYNVGWLSFRRDARGLGCLERWRDQCLEWCYDRTEPGRYGDQKYLDEWPQLWGAHVVQHAGAGLAPWNWEHYAITQGKAEAEGRSQLFSNGVPLIFFHFHGLRFLNSWLYDAVYGEQLQIGAAKRRLLFEPYLRTMKATARWARAQGCRLDFGYMPFKKYVQSYGKSLLIKKLARRQLVVHRGLK